MYSRICSKRIVIQFHGVSRILSLLSVCWFVLASSPTYILKAGFARLNIHYALYMISASSVLHYWLDLSILHKLSYFEIFKSCL